MKAICRWLAVFLMFSSTGVLLGASRKAVWDFPQNPRTDAQTWLKQQGFVLKKGAADSAQFQLSCTADGLTIHAVKPALGLIVKDGLRISGFQTLTLRWGVRQYPPKANWDTGVHNEPLMVYVFFGDQRYSSDSIFIPNSPAFIGFYLGQQDKVGGGHTGRHFTTGGRYVCVANPPPGQTITSEIDLAAEFRKAFGKTIPLPAFISGISIESDTSDLDSGSESVAFIRSLVITSR